MAYLFATLHQLDVQPGETIAAAWEREQTRLADLNDRAIFATGAIECPPGAGIRGWDIDVISHGPEFGANVTKVLPRVEDEEIVPNPIEERDMTNHAETLLRRVISQGQLVRGDGLELEIKSYLDSLSTATLSGVISGPDENNVILVSPGTLVQYQHLGVAVNCDRRDPEFDEQIFVSINTEDHAERDNIPGTSEPLLDVHLNDATIYDGEEVFRSRKMALADKLKNDGVDVEVDHADPEALRSMAEDLTKLADLINDTSA